MMGAFYSERAASLRGRHKRTLDLIADWSATPSGSGLLWVHGPPRVGKSAIANTIAGSFHSQRRLVGFVSLSAKCSDPLRVLPTLAYQFAKWSPPYREEILGILKSSQELECHSDCSRQFELLINRPISRMRTSVSTPHPLMIVLDGIEPAKEDDAERHGMESLVKNIVLISHLVPWMKVVIFVSLPVAGLEAHSAVESALIVDHQYPPIETMDQITVSKNVSLNILELMELSYATANASDPTSRDQKHLFSHCHALIDIIAFELKHTTAAEQVEDLVASDQGFVSQENDIAFLHYCIDAVFRSIADPHSPSDCLDTLSPNLAQCFCLSLIYALVQNILAAVMQLGNPLPSDIAHQLTIAFTSHYHETILKTIGEALSMEVFKDGTSITFKAFCRDLRSHLQSHIHISGWIDGIPQLEAGETQILVHGVSPLADRFKMFIFSLAEVRRVSRTQPSFASRLSAEIVEGLLQHLSLSPCPQELPSGTKSLYSLVYAISDQWAQSNSLPPRSPISQFLLHSTSSSLMTVSQFHLRCAQKCYKFICLQRGSAKFYHGHDLIEETVLQWSLVYWSDHLALSRYFAPQPSWPEQAEAQELANEVLRNILDSRIVISLQNAQNLDGSVGMIQRWCRMLVQAVILL